MLRRGLLEDGCGGIDARTEKRGLGLDFAVVLRDELDFAVVLRNELAEDDMDSRSPKRLPNNC